MVHDVPVRTGVYLFRARPPRPNLARFTLRHSPKFLMFSRPLHCPAHNN